MKKSTWKVSVIRIFVCSALRHISIHSFVVLNAKEQKPPYKMILNRTCVTYVTFASVQTVSTAWGDEILLLLQIYSFLSFYCYRESLPRRDRKGTINREFTWLCPSVESRCMMRDQGWVGRSTFILVIYTCTFYSSPVNFFRFPTNANILVIFTLDGLQNIVV